MSELDSQVALAVVMLLQREADRAEQTAIMRHQLDVMIGAPTLMEPPREIAEMRAMGRKIEALLLEGKAKT